MSNRIFWRQRIRKKATNNNIQLCKLILFASNCWVEHISFTYDWRRTHTLNWMCIVWRKNVNKNNTYRCLWFCVELSCLRCMCVCVFFFRFDIQYVNYCRCHKQNAFHDICIRLLSFAGILYICCCFCWRPPATSNSTKLENDSFENLIRTRLVGFLLMCAISQKYILYSLHLWNGSEIV